MPGALLKGQRNVPELCRLFCRRQVKKTLELKDPWRPDDRGADLDGCLQHLVNPKFPSRQQRFAPDSFGPEPFKQTCLMLLRIARDDNEILRPERPGRCSLEQPACLLR